MFTQNINQRKRSQNGFTLVEIMVVLAISALILGLVPPLLSNAIAVTKVKSASRELAVNLKQARNESVEKQAETTLTLNIDSYQYSLGKQQAILSLPEDVSLKLITAKSEQLSDSSGQIRFFPDGSSTGGQIKLSYQKQNILVDVNWLTGKVTITP